MSDFDVIMQLREHYLQEIVAELSRTARPLIAKTFDEIEPLEVENVLIHPCVNVENGTTRLNLLPESNAVRLLLEDIELQIKTQKEFGFFPGEPESLHEMRANLGIEVPVEGQVEEGQVAIGIDPMAITSEQISVEIVTGHPLEDDTALLELMNRLLQKFYWEGEIPVFQSDTGVDAGALPYTIDYELLIANDDGGDITRTLRVVEVPGAGNYRLIVPIEVWANLYPDDPAEDLQYVNFTATIAVTFELVRQLVVSPAFVEARLSEGVPKLEDIQAISGEEFLENPLIAAAMANFVIEQGTEWLEDFNDPHVNTPTMGQLIELLQSLIRDGLQSDGRFIPFWSSAQTTELQDATPKILEGILAIGMNASDNADADTIEAFIPDDRDFAVKLAPEFFIDEIEKFLHARAEYDDVKGKLRLVGDHAAGNTAISVDKFKEETGTVLAGTRVNIEGSTYMVTDDAEISNKTAGLMISPGLTEIGEDNDRVRVQYGFGIPRTFDAGGNDRTLKLNSLIPSLRDGHIGLEGEFRLRRPHAVIRNIDGETKLKMGLDWSGAAKVDGGGQSGGSLNIKDLATTIKDIPRNTIILIDGTEQSFEVTETADVAGGATTLSITPSLPESPSDNAMVLVRWRAIGRVNGSEHTEDFLRVDGLTDGIDLIPKGSRLEIEDETFELKEDAPLEDGTATLALTEALGDDVATNNADIRFFGGWNGRATVDGGNQTGSTLNVAGLVRVIPRRAALTIDGINGTFSVQETADIVDNAAEIELDHPVVTTLSSLTGASGNDMWALLGQPSNNAIVRIRSGGQGITPRIIGEPEVELEGIIEGVVGLIIGILVTVFTGGNVFLGLILAVISAFVTQAIVKALGGRAVSDRLRDNMVDVPLPETLANLDIGVDSYFNNPVEVMADGIVMAGSARSQTMFRSVVESRAQANGPYEFAAGLIANFAGGHDAPATDYVWRSGDGALLNGLNPSHTYARRGLYVADHTSLDRQWGWEIRTRHLAAVRVRNSLPVLGALPTLQAAEGEEVELTVSFVDPAWTDSHRAFVDFGDKTLPVEATVTETNQPPTTIGELTASHTYCDNGVFVVTVILIDAQGGTDRQTTEARIVNVPAVVNAGEDIFTHPCVPVRLVGHFEDQGWCDTHTGTWDFGDCSPIFPATIFETHEPPKAIGQAIATHCYAKCGTFVATLIIEDDDGATTRDTLTVTSSDLRNGNFEEGFAHHSSGQVGNGWNPYAEPLNSSIANATVFHCEECVVCTGCRAQAVLAAAFAHAGIHQSLETNVGWEYQLVAGVSVLDSSSTVWLGVDPLGGTDRTAQSVLWHSVAANPGWQRLSNLVVAQAAHLTVFLEAREPGPTPVIFDCIAMQAYPCPYEKAPEGRPEGELRCLAWRDIDHESTLPSQIEKHGFSIRTIAETNLRTVTFGLPQGESKLAIPDRHGTPNVLDGLRVSWQGIANKVTAKVSGLRRSEISMVALDSNAQEIGTVGKSDGSIRDLEFSFPGIAMIELHSINRGTVLEFCIEQDGLPHDTLL